MNYLSDPQHDPDTSKSPAGRTAVQPLARPHRPATGGNDEPGLLLQYLRTFSRYRGTIGLAALIGLVAGMLLYVAALPVYQARTSINIQSLNGDFMDQRTVARTNEGAGGSPDAEVQTQIKLMQSETLLDNTAARMEAEPHTEMFARTDLLSRWEHALHLQKESVIPYSEVVHFAAQNVKVKPLGLTRIIEVTCDSWDPQLSARFCNTLVREFQDEDLQARASEAQETSDWLSRQAEDVRLKAQDLQKQLEVSVGGNGLFLSQESNSVGEDRLREIQQELVRAKADRMEKEARYAIASSASPDTVPGVVDRPGYLNYQQKLADLRAQVAQLVPPLTEENPKVKHLRSQIQEMEAGLAIERTSDTATIRNEYDASRHREALLAATYQATEENVSRDLGKAAQVSMLRREVDSEQQLYQTLQQRAKEAGFASAMKASTLHVVDAARSPKIPVAPRRGAADVVGVLLGSMVGVGFAFFKDRNFEVLRMPGDSRRILHLHELGVIPSAEVNSRKRLGIARQPASLGLGSAPSPFNLPQSNALALARWGDGFSIVAEAYRNTTLSILLSEIASRSSKTYVIASPNASDGKTTVTCNLGVALSRSKLRVLLVDGDLRRPALHTALDIPNEAGLRDLLSSDQALTDSSVLQLCRPTGVPNLSVLTSGIGREEAVELLHSPKLQELISLLGKVFDVVLIDTPPMLHMADARLFAGKMDGVILIFRAGVTTRDEAISAVDLFDRDHAHLVGTILNGFNPSREGKAGYYESYFRYKDDLPSSKGADAA